MPRPDETLEIDRRWLRRLARRMARPPGSAEDLVQETYLTVLGKPPPDGPMRPWLLGVMRKLAWREIRGGRRRARREETFQLAEPSVAEPDPLLDYGIDRDRLRSIVEELPEPFRSTVEQRFVEGLSCAEIARAAGVPPGTVRWRQSRALELLRAELERPAPRRARRLLWLPLVALERVASIGPRAVGLTGRGRGLVALVGVALVLALTTSMQRDGSVDPEPEGRRRGAAIRLNSAAAFGPATRAPADDSTLVSAPPRPIGRAESARVPAARRGASPSTSRSARSEGAPGQLPRDLYDCTDEGGTLRCVRREVAADQAAGGPVCVILERSLAALDRARFGRSTRSAYGAAFRHAARLANLFLAAELGCALAVEPEPDEPRGGGGGVLATRPPEPTCQSQEEESGQTCTTCTDERGATTRVCAPVECQPGTRTDGTPCTTCTDADGQVESDCEVEASECAVLDDLLTFENEIQPILAGELDLNDREGRPRVGCTRGPCHGVPRPDHFSLGGTPEENLASFACYVDLEHPEESPILLCARGDEACTATPHPGEPQLTDPEDLNVQRILSYIQASAR